MTVAQMKLRNGNEIPLSTESLEEAAAAMPEGDASRLEVVVQDRRVEAASLVARATGLRSDEIGLASVQDALLRLKFTLVWGDDKISPSELIVPERVRDLPGLAEGTDGLSLTAKASTELQRHKGEWPAVTDGHLLRTATSLFKLHELLGESDATVFWIPTERPSEDVGD